MIKKKKWKKQMIKKQRENMKRKKLGKENYIEGEGNFKEKTRKKKKEALVID